MGIFDKLKKRVADDDDLDFDDESNDPDSSDSDSETSGGGFLGRLRNLRRKGAGNDDDDDELDDFLDDPEESPDDSKIPDDADANALPDDNDSPDIQVVRLEGVPDVHPVGGQGGTSMAPATPSGGGSNPTAATDAPGPPDGGSSGEESAAGTTEAAAEQEEAKVEAKDGNKGLSQSLMGIFEEEIEVDEALRDLAESMEDIPVQELADELKGFYEELEARMG
jgi:hypothetical protein